MRAFNAVLLVAALVILGIQVYRAGPRGGRGPADATPASHLYFNDATVEMLASAGPAPVCTVRFRPAMTFGGGLAPRLVLAAKGPSQLSFGIENPEQYSNPVIVQHNTRTPLAAADDASTDQFRASNLAAALKSRRLFFVTARRAEAGGGAARYVSSRYERIDVDMVLAKIEACRSDGNPPAAATASRLDVHRFDGAWRADLTCESTPSGLVGWRFQFTGRLSNGAFHGQRGTVGTLEAQVYEGTVAPDGSMTIWEKTIISSDPVRPKGVFASIYTGKLDRVRGEVKRYDRPCHMTLSKQ